jgi:outer membrane protein assembly factor BamB
MPRIVTSWLALLPTLFVPALAAAADPLDWPYWRGPEMNGISRELHLPETWSPDGENLVWKNEALGTRSTPIVLNGKLYTLCRHKPQTAEEAEKVVCADINTGEILWENIFNVFLSDVPDTRVGWSSVVGDPETGDVYALGVCGYFQCIDGETGKTKWARSLSEEFGLLTTYGGRTNFPIVYDNLAIISGVVIGWGEMAKPAFRLMGFDKRNGQCVWFSSTRLFPADTTYSAPVISVIDGQAQLMIGSGDGSVYGLQPRTGKILWNYSVTIRGVNATPLVVGYKVLCGHGEENLSDPTKMGAFFAVDARQTGNITKTGELWRATGEFVSKGQPLAVDGRVYGVDEGGMLFTHDLESGKLLGKKKLGIIGRASPVYGDGKIYIGEGTGRFYILRPDGDKLEVLSQLRLNSDINGSAIISHGKVFIPTEAAMYAIGLPDVKPEAAPMPEPEREKSVSEDVTPATALVTPVEVLLKPGQKQQFKVWLYNANGQFLRVADKDDVKYSVEGPGQVDAQGKYQSEEAKEHAACVVTAAVGDVKGEARIRVIPDFPWEITYDNGVIPVTGIGMRYRNIGIDHDYYMDLKGRDPLAAKLYIYFLAQFINGEKPAAKFDDTTPQQAWTQLRRYLDIVETVTTQDQGKEKLDAALESLKNDEVIKDWTWTGDEKTGPQLTVMRGPRKVVGNGVMCKITTIPLGTRSQGWIGRADSKDYVIQADAMANKPETAAGADPNSKLPDIGVINQRYRMELMGASQEVKVYSWYPHDQKLHTVAFPWEPEVWYTLKFQVNNELRDGVEYSVCRGKVWKRSESEPEEWTIEWADTPANDHGSPGLFGNAKDTEIFIDNVKLTPQK